MAAFVSAGTGNWNVNGTWTTAGYPGDGVSGVTDTWTIANGHTITMPWGTVALTAVVGAGTIALGGTLSWAAGFTSAWCGGNITLNGTLSSPADANAKVIWMSGDVAITTADANTAHLNLQSNTDLHFVITSAPTSTGCKGGVNINNAAKFTMEGTSSASKDAKITGTAGKECFVYVQKNSSAVALGGLNNCTFNYCGRRSAGFLAALNIANANMQRVGQFPIGNIDVTNPCNVAGAESQGVYFSSSAVESTTGTITATTPGSAWGIYFYQSVVYGGTFAGTSVSGTGIYVQQSIIEAGTLAGVSTSSNAVYFNASIMNAGTASGTSTSGYGVITLGFTLNGGAVTGTSSSSRGFSSVFLYQGGGTFTGVSTTGVAGYVDIGTRLAGGAMNIQNASGGGGVGYSCQPISFNQTGGNLTITGNTIGIDLRYHSAATYQKTGTKGFSLYGNTAAFSNEVYWQGNEPLIYRNHASNKTCTIYFPCSPWNAADFSTTGTVDFSVTTAGAITIAATGGSVTFPQVQPWDVAAYDAISWLISGGNTPVFEYRYSTDNGSSWSAWTTMTTPQDISSISAGLNGNDIIQIRATNPAGAAALTLTNFTITFNYSRETSPAYSEEAEGPLFYPTYAKAGAYITVWATMPDDATEATVTLYTDAGAVETLTSATAVQKSGTAQWYWSTTNITTQPTTITHYRVQFKDQNNNKVFRDLYLGGTEDDIITTKINAGLIPALV